jgi:hypothetical protein
MIRYSPTRGPINNRSPVGPPTCHRRLLLGPRARLASRRNPPSLEHPNALQNKSQSRHRLRPPPAPHRPQRMSPHTPPRKRLRRKPSSRNDPATSHVAADLPSQRNLRHDPLRQTLFLGLFERSQRQTQMLNSSCIQADDDFKANECFDNKPTSKDFDLPES